MHDIQKMDRETEYSTYRGLEKVMHQGRTDFGVTSRREMKIGEHIFGWSALPGKLYLGKAIKENQILVEHHSR